MTHHLPQRHAHTINKTNVMVDILLLSPKGAYGSKVPKAEENIDWYKDQSAQAIKFSYNNDADDAGAEMGIKKVSIELVQRLLPSNVCQTHPVEATGDKKSLKDVTIHDIIQSIQTESIKPGSQDTNTGILKRQRSPQWSEASALKSRQSLKTNTRSPRWGSQPTTQSSRITPSPT